MSEGIQSRWSTTGVPPYLRRTDAGTQTPVRGKIGNSNGSGQGDQMMESLLLVVRCLTGHATGGGTFGCYCVRNGGGHEKFFRKVDSFWRSPRAVENAKSYQLFEKIFRVPPRCEHSNTQMSPPPVACPVIHNFGIFLEFLMFLMGMFCIKRVVGK